jgi:hypothetical protein
MSMRRGKGFSGIRLDFYPFTFCGFANKLADLSIWGKVNGQKPIPILLVRLGTVLQQRNRRVTYP